MEITLDRTTPTDEHVIRHFFVANFYDLSQWDDLIIINHHGLPMWGPAGLPGPSTPEECFHFNKWIRADAAWYIVRVDGFPAGYTTIISDKSHLPAGIDYELFDLYITPHYRRKGIGWQATRLTLAQHHGAWQVFYLHKNLPAKTFWDRFIDEYMGGQYQDVPEERGMNKRFRN